uniref:Reverse transcriptase Ty1/copia-type domain-containing protein n=1 Tax=Amphimedon queenslandica TaxID=400682 RepID=A0A1X7TB01_AMPQE
MKKKDACGYIRDSTLAHFWKGNLFMMSGGAVSWLSRKQPVVALSTTETEYIALSLATQEATWLKRLLSDIATGPSKLVTINEDNQGTIAVAKNPVSHARTKHIDIKYHYVREALQNGTIDLVYCPTENMIADIFTKPLSRNRFEILRTEMGLVFLQETK